MLLIRTHEVSKSFMMVGLIFDESAKWTKFLILMKSKHSSLIPTSYVYVANFHFIQQLLEMFDYHVEKI